MEDKELIKFLEDQPWPKFITENQLPKSAEELLKELEESINQKEE